MNMRPLFPYVRNASLLLAGIGLGTFTAAADLTFSRTPLFLESGVQPNIYFIIDDSGSMNWETIYTKGGQDHFNYPNNGSGVGTIELVPDIDDIDEQNWDNTWLSGQAQNVRNSILQLCRGVNALHYNPVKDYSPWVGVDENGNAFTDQDINDAQSDPYENPGADTDLLFTEGDGDRTGYIQWLDTNGNGDLDEFVDINENGVVDLWVDHADTGNFNLFVDLNGNGVFDGWVDLDGDDVRESGEFETETELECPDPWYMGRELNMSGSEIEEFVSHWLVAVEDMDAAEQTNYANWYSYFRKRKWVSKKALSSIIDSSTARMGINTIWNRNPLDIKDVDDISFRGIEPEDIAASEAAEDNKEELLERMFDIGSSGGTPLRNALNRAGNYFDNTGSNAPILPADEGGTCQQNFAILFTDGVWNGGNPGVGNQDANTGNEFDGGDYADTFSNTLADVAMLYYKNDLRPDLDNNVPKIEDIDENDAQHLVTYTVAFGVSGDLEDDDLPGAVGWTGWPQPTSNTPSTIDDVKHAAYNGRGLFLSAQDPDELINALNNAINDIDGRDRSASSASVNTGSISSTTMLFQAQFNGRQWTGHVNGVPVNSDGSVDVDAKRLSSFLPAPADRVIITSDGTDGIPFQWNRLTTTQQSLIGSEDVLDYLRGSMAQEERETSGVFRNRFLLAEDRNPTGANTVATVEDSGATGYDRVAGAPLGDIVNSSPAYVGNPNFLYPNDFEDKPYSEFALNPDGDSTYFTITDGVNDKYFYRTPMLYVGANDGMLHAFNVSPQNVDNNEFGKEVFAYVPNMLYDKLEDLTDPDYLHEYYVDGTPYVGDAYFNDQWNTVLVSGLNGGGQGVFALNVTNPESFDTEVNASDNVLWEFSDADDADLGYTYSTPVIAKANNGDWVAIFGNGYNNTVTDSNIGSGTAVLYVVRLEDGALLKKIDTGINDLGVPNGLSTPTTADFNGDYHVDAVYAGDMEGNMWKFDLSDPSPSNWDVAFNSGGDARPLYTACREDVCSDSNRQPITVKPEVGINKGAEGYIVYFGTGTYMLTNDNRSKAMQSFYGIWDKNEGSYTAFTRKHLLRQEVIEEIPVASTGQSQRVTTNTPIYWHSGSGLPTDGPDAGSEVDTQLGWYLDLYNTKSGTNSSSDGERVVSNPILRDDSIIFVSIIPNPDPCSTGGSGWYMEINASSGARHDTPVIDVDGDGDVDDQDYIASTANGDVPSSGTSTGSLATTPVCITLPNGVETCKSTTTEATLFESTRDAGSALGRWSWREL